MAPVELNYVVHDKEILDIIYSFGNWRAELASSPHKTRVFTDHKGLEYSMSSKALNSRQAHWAELLANFNIVICYRPDTQQEATINLIDVSSISPPIGSVDQALAVNRNALSLQTLQKKAASPIPGKFLLSNGLLLFDERLLVPDIDSIHTLLIREAHDQVYTTHPSAK
ncbi:hypothetical protein K3495_g10044 [Podosphaera aphanis]|nr:hypothetical protein K3495_g10044 [Podosphaera aphanis]